MNRRQVAEIMRAHGVCDCHMCLDAEMKHGLGRAEEPNGGIVFGCLFFIVLAVALIWGLV